MTDPRTIGALAHAAGVPASTVRYYERRGLLTPHARSRAGNYRLYDDGSLDRLRFILAAKGAGFTLTDIRTLLDVQDGNRAPCCEVQDLISARLQEVQRQERQLRRARRVLAHWLDECRGAQASGRCPVIAGLHETGRARPSQSDKKNRKVADRP